MKKMNKKGFTLIEMLVVIAIIAVLVAIIIPTVTSATDKAAAATNAANLRSAKAEITTALLASDSSKYTFTTDESAKTITVSLTDTSKNLASDVITAKKCGAVTTNAAFSVSVDYTTKAVTVAFVEGGVTYDINSFATCADNGTLAGTHTCDTKGTDGVCSVCGK